MKGSLSEALPQTSAPMCSVALQVEISARGVSQASSASEGPVFAEHLWEATFPRALWGLPLNRMQPVLQVPQQGGALVPP